LISSTVPRFSALNPNLFLYTAVTSPPASKTALAADFEYLDKNNLSGGNGRLVSASPNSLIPENLFARPWTIFEEIRVWIVMGSEGDIRA
jgi:hypothetical protein